MNSDFLNLATTDPYKGWSGQHPNVDETDCHKDVPCARIMATICSVESLWTRISVPKSTFRMKHMKGQSVLSCWLCYFLRRKYLHSFSLNCSSLSNPTPRLLSRTFVGYSLGSQRCVIPLKLRPMPLCLFSQASLPPHSIFEG